MKRGVFVVDNESGRMDIRFGMLPCELPYGDYELIEVETCYGYVLERTEDTISFYVAECMEYPVMGEYHENLTLQEAYELYDKIPPERINGVKGIGFRLEDGSIYDGLFELMSGGTVVKDVINEIPHYKESPLVQKAIADLEKILSENREREVAPEVKEPESEQPEKASTVEDKAGMEASSETVLMPGKALETHSSAPEGTGRKQSVLKALRERQVKLKSQEQKGTEQSARLLTYLLQVF